MTNIKICGLMEPEHVTAAVEAGADFIDFVFAKSKRQITVEQAKTLASSIPANVKKVGVFVNEDPETIRHIFETVPLDYVQYHGDETNELIQQIGLPSIKAFSVNEHTNFDEISQYNVDYFLFDAPGVEYRGGSGHTFDWNYLNKCPIDRSRIFLAGGLNAANVQSAIQQTQPFCVDVSSSVETDGKKDVSKIQVFIETAKGVAQQ